MSTPPSEAIPSKAVAAWVSAGLDSDGRGLDLLLIQCQFSLGCCLTCTLAFLHQGALHSSLSLFLAAALSWALAKDQLRQAFTESLFHTVVLQLGTILVLMLTVGKWSDVLYVLIVFVGEASGGTNGGNAMRRR
ncbi:hypothetical protein INR49_029585 [Caranx melampygus]|nr:hypothetical protein INR49_029585 [Caranx melampygus]